MTNRINRLSAAAFMAAALVTGGHNVFAAEVSDSCANICATGNANSTVKRVDDLRRYLPKIGAALRPRYELDTEHGSSRFQIRNARVRLSGTINSVVDYFMQTDFCDEGKIRMLDAYVGFRPDSRWYLQVGQTRVPFSVDAARSPGNYLFANRSFIGRYIGNQRSVGIRGCYTPASVPIAIEGGVFNSAAMGEHAVWLKHFTYSIEARGTIAGMLSPIVSFKSDVPSGGVRTNLLSAAMTLRSGHWMAEGEYALQTYSHGRFKRCHGFNLQGQYMTPVKLGMFNRWSAELRYDGMSDHSNAVLDSDGRLDCTNIRRRRITAGTTLSYVRGSTHVDVRANYEQYFYPSGYSVPEGAGNKLVAELVLYF